VIKDILLYTIVDSDVLPLILLMMQQSV